MKIAIITDSIEKGPTSVGKYTENLVRNLLEINIDKKVDIILIHGERRNIDIYKKAREIMIPFFKKRKQSFFPIRVLVFLLTSLWNIKRNFEIIKFYKKEDADVLHIPHLGRPAPPIAYLVFDFDNTSLIVTNHGMANLALPPRLCWGKFFTVSRIIYYIEYLKWKYLFRTRFKIMITVSHSEKKNIVKSLGISPEKIKVIYHGADYKNCKSKRNREAGKILYQNYGINFPFIFHLSAYQPKKNVENIIKAFAIAKKKYNKILKKKKLIIGGKQPNRLKRLAKDLGIEDDVIFVGFIPEEELPLFYSVAEAFVFPSFHESFGMPILEAMACGCPVITSNVFSMPEVAGKTAILVDPYNPEKIANAIYKVVSDKKLRRKLTKWGIERAKKFTWKRCAKEHLKCYVEGDI
ncbi:glycosyltransferase [Geoglobus acetivorans]|uniref:Glycosyltransferase family 4 protein n=1 Tax=Geoglobus acetivorans TaxID=565033 RepID=A0ABZ3H2X0_GEOAI|nr:glycosyltransferase family 4 protein [Geoglobus acetivorans]